LLVSRQIQGWPQGDHGAPTLTAAGRTPDPGVLRRAGVFGAVAREDLFAAARAQERGLEPPRALGVRGGLRQGALEPEHFLVHLGPPRP